MWPLSPYGSVTDVMIERADGHRILLAPTQELADFIAATYQFDEVRVTPVLRVRDGKKWMVSTDELALTFDVGRSAGAGLAADRAAPTAGQGALVGHRCRTRSPGS